MSGLGGLSQVPTSKGKGKEVPQHSISKPDLA
jgi:hypothetical protein